VLELEMNLNLLFKKLEEKKNFFTPGFIVCCTPNPVGTKLDFG